MPVWREEMAKKKVGAYITLDGEKEFRSAVTQCNKSLSTMKSEMKLVEAETAGNANSVDTLRKKNEVLTRTLDKQVEKEEAVRKGLTHAQEDYARVGTELQEYRTKLEQAQSTLDEMKQSSDVSEEALSRQQEAVSELTEKVEKGEATYQRAGNRVEDWQKQLNNAQAQTIKATRAVNENTAYLEEAEKATDGCAKSIDKFGKQTDDVAEKITSTGKIIKANLINTMVDAGKSLATNVFKDAVQGTLELQDAQQKLQASTGATARETAAYSQEMQNLYKGGYGDAIDEAASAMALVKQYTNETDPTKIKELAENGMALEDVFGMDLSESIRGADALVTNMGIDGKTAFDLMAKGAQNGLNKSGELADNLTEYSSLWAQAGFSAEEMFAILENGLNSGAYNLDKVNDYVKEFGNSLADGRIDDHIKSFSAGTQDLVKKWHDGSATTKEVFQSVISDLASMKNEQEALTLASDTWSALGEDNAMKVITSLNNVNNSYKNVQGTMEKVKDIKYDSITNQWKVLGRTVQADVVQPLLVKYLPMAQKGIKLVADNLETIVPVAELAGTAIGGIFVVNKSKKFISEVKDAGVSLVDFGKKAAELIGIRTAATTAEAASTVAQEAQAAATATQTAATVALRAATEGATVAQAGFNAVLAANPAILVVAGVTALIGVTAVLASKMGDATSETDELIQSTSELKDKASETSEALKQATQNMTSSMEEQLLTSGAANIAGGMDGLTSVMQESGTNTVMGLVQGMQNAQEKANAAGKDLGVKTVEAVNNGLGCQSPSKKTRESGKNVDLGLVQGMKNGESNVKTEARSVASGAINVFAAQCTASKTQLYGYNLSIGLANGISDGRSAVISAASRVASDAIATAKKKLEINSPSKVFWRMGQYSMQGLANGVTENSLLAQNAVKEAVDYSGTSMTFGNMAENEYTQYKALRNIIKDAVKDLQIRAYLGEREVTRTLSDWGVVFNA